MVHKISWYTTGLICVKCMVNALILVLVLLNALKLHLLKFMRIEVTDFAMCSSCVDIK